MSSFLVINDVSKAIRAILVAGFAADPQTRSDGGTEDDITFASPRDAKPTSASQALKGNISLFLYQVEENEFLKAQSMLPTGTPGQLRHPPLSLNLRYLLTPIMNDPDKNQILLGRAMQVLRENTSMTGPFAPVAPGVSPDVRVLFDPLSFEELTRLWSAMSEPYRLSVCYEARVVALPSSRAEVRAPMVERRHVDVRQIVGNNATDGSS